MQFSLSRIKQFKSPLNDVMAALVVSYIWIKTQVTRYTCEGPLFFSSLFPSLFSLLLARQDFSV